MVLFRLQHRRGFWPHCNLLQLVCAHRSEKTAVKLLKLLGSYFLQSGANVVDDIAHEASIITFRHHTDERLCARGADHNTASVCKAVFTFGNGFFDQLVFQRVTFAVANIAQNLRNGFKT